MLPIVGVTGHEGVTLDTQEGFLGVQNAPPEGSGACRCGISLAG